MQDKELEKLLQEKADKTELREFSQVWNEIKGEIVSPKPKKEFKWKKWFPMIMASAVLVICLALSPLIINMLTPNKPQEEVFFTEELIRETVTEKEMFDGLATAKITLIDTSKYILEGVKLLVTEKNQVKGASFSFYNDPTTFLAEMRIYHKSVDLNLDTDILQWTIYTVGSTNIRYKFLQESEGLYDYSVYAVHNSVQYFIEYTGLSDNLIDFLNEFFG